jgi:hypothetical protein|eukprot:COSAG01_NODE_1080_length_11819_cov_29.816212_8_plen_122_part_00
MHSHYLSHSSARHVVLPGGARKSVARSATTASPALGSSRRHHHFTRARRDSSLPAPSPQPTASTLLLSTWPCPRSQDDGRPSLAEGKALLGLGDQVGEHGIDEALLVLGDLAQAVDFLHAL